MIRIFKDMIYNRICNVYSPMDIDLVEIRNIRVLGILLLSISILKGSNRKSEEVFLMPYPR